MFEVERAILDRLLAMDFDGVAELRVQADHVTAVEGNCACGCPSITPAIDRSQAGAAQLERTLLPAELQEVSRSDGVPRTVLCFADTDGYLANLECVYYDEPVDEWPSAQSCAILLRDREGYVVAAELPSGHLVRPRQTGDAWASIEFTDGGMVATTFSGFRELFSHDGDLIERRFVK